MPLPDNSQPIGRFSMREEVYNSLLTWIMEGTLCPGEKILDKDLAERLGVSRTPVREALRRLEDKGLIESAANRWTRVAKISLSEPIKFYTIIWTLEELAVSEVINELTEKDFKQMRELNNTLAKAVKDEDPVKASWADVEFHRTYIDKTGNSHLIRILNDLKIKFRRVEVTYFGGCKKVDDSMREHNDIISALQKRDLDLAKALIRRNWQNSLSRLQGIADADRQQDNPTSDNNI